MAFQRYYSLKTFNVSLHILNTKKQHTCKTLSNFFRNVFFWHFLHPEAAQCCVILKLIDFYL